MTNDENEAYVRTNEVPIRHHDETLRPCQGSCERAGPPLNGSSERMITRLALALRGYLPVAVATLLGNASLHSLFSVAPAPTAGAAASAGRTYETYVVPFLPILVHVSGLSPLRPYHCE